MASEDSSVRFQLQSAHTGSKMKFKTHKDTPFAEVIRTYCKRQGIEEPGEYRFMFEGMLIKPEDKPSGIELEDEDIIYVHKRQIGG